jgi:putative membrane protein
MADNAGRAYLPRAQIWMIIALLVAVGLVSIDQPHPDVAPIHHVPTVLLALAAPWLLKRWPLSNKAAGCITVFMLLHTLGGRYTYSNVPYDAWATTLTGHSVSVAFGFTRNHYDRLVHLAFGLCIAPVVFEVLQEYAGIGRKLAIYLAIELVFATSALYEIFEWLLTLAAANATADAYNGQQGDIWDAQKDMAIAAFGAMVFAVFTVVRWHKRGESG